MPGYEKIVLRDGSADTRSLWQRGVDALESARRSFTINGLHPRDPAIARLFSGPPASSGESVNERRALCVSAWWSGGTMIASDCASLPLHLHLRDRNGGRRRYVEHSLYRLMHDEWNPEMSAMQGRESVLLSAVTVGDGFAEIERDGAGRPIALWPLEPSIVTSFRDEQRRRLYRVPGVGGGDVILTPRDMLHLRGPSPTGEAGYNVVELSRETLGRALASEKYAGIFYKNYASVGGIVTSPQSLTPAARENLKAALAARHQGVDKAHGLMLLENGLTYTATSTTPRDAQYAELLEADIRAIARFLRLPAAMLNELSRATWSNYSQSQAQYFSQTLRSWLVRFEQELNRTLISSVERTSQFFEHDTAGFLRGDPAERSAYYTALLDRGVVTINEVRRWENLSPVDGGDIPRTPLNFEPLRAIRGAGIPAEVIHVPQE